jgi:mannose-6-phosphate isomerase-like protein (cupin superfamily)
MITMDKKEAVMAGYVANIEEKTLANRNFRQVLFTATKSQLVVMALQPGEDIGTEVHHDVDQFIRVESGTGKAVLNGEEYEIGDGSAIVIPAGVEHNVINTSQDSLMQLYTLYTPPEHEDQKVHKTKADALADEHDHYQG